MPLVATGSKAPEQQKIRVPPVDDDAINRIASELKILNEQFGTYVRLLHEADVKDAART